MPYSKSEVDVITGSVLIIKRKVSHLRPDFWNCLLKTNKKNTWHTPLFTFGKQLSSCCFQNESLLISLPNNVALVARVMKMNVQKPCVLLRFLMCCSCVSARSMGRISTSRSPGRSSVSPSTFTPRVCSRGTWLSVSILYHTHTHTQQCTWIVT